MITQRITQLHTTDWPPSQKSIKSQNNNNKSKIYGYNHSWWMQGSFCRQSILVQCTSQTGETSQGLTVNAAQRIKQYYEYFNSSQITKVGDLVAEDVLYQDMIYSKPFKGKFELLSYLNHVKQELGDQDLKFVIDEVTDGGGQSVGVTWHVETGSVVFPFSRGCSFYRFNDQGQLVWAQDFPEPTSKIGSSTFPFLKFLAPIVRKLGSKASPDTLPSLPIEQIGFAIFYIGYFYYVLLSSDAPGTPAQNTPPEAITSLINQSLNFFYVNIGFNALGVNVIPDIPSHPVEEAIFNFVNSWSLMLLPIILSDGKSQKVKNKLAWWLAIFFSTNLSTIPFLSARGAPPPPSPDPKITNPDVIKFLEAKNKPLPNWSPLVGATSFVIGLVSIAWFCVGRPEYGDLFARLDQLRYLFTQDRVYYAFLLDMSLYGVWQFILMNGAPLKYRVVPYFGMAAWLIVGRNEQQNQAQE